jgi:hypothetical protein
MTGKRLCHRCEQMVPERGIHACVPVAKTSPIAREPSSNIAASSSASSNKYVSASSNGPRSRNARWRAAHPEHWRRIMRVYMRRKRAEAKAS